MSDPYSTHPYPAKTEVRRRWSAESIKATKTWQGLKIVALNCDNARNADGAGFGSYDAQFGKDIVAKGETYGWSEAQFRAAHKLAHKYRKQIALAGITEDQIAFEDIATTVADAKPPSPRAGDELVWVKGSGRSKGLTPSGKAEIVTNKGELSRGPVTFVPLSVIKAKRCSGPSDNVHLLVPRWWAIKNERTLDIVPEPELPLVADLPPQLTEAEVKARRA